MLKSNVKHKKQSPESINIPKFDLVLDLSIIALLLGLLSTDLFASEMSAVTLVIDILHLMKQSHTVNRMVGKCPSSTTLTLNMA